MPCDAGGPGYDAVRISRILCLIDEVGGKQTIDPGHWAGYHPGVSKLREQEIDLDDTAAELVPKLCETLQGLDTTKYSLELQMWWRDHRMADEARVSREIAKAKSDRERVVALAKLTPYERKLLGL